MWKNERQVAGLSSVNGWEVEVEKSGFCLGDIGAETVTNDPVRVCVVDGYDETWDFEGTGELRGVGCWDERTSGSDRDRETGIGTGRKNGDGRRGCSEDRC